MSRRLEGRKALITGAATGMGRATAELFSRHGAEVIAFGLGSEALDGAAKASGNVAVHGDLPAQTMSRAPSTPAAGVSTSSSTPPG
ncbi:SDR family NAD(P)-dependent oxidoreductase [Mesorhizobium sp. M0152]|uniref:SDR family NAD(P)-dependent oxidoreductase n=1 Tax=Mesorhizobium sp. M0152 TaxID=2956898 RepID=UPI00333DE26D